MSELIDELLADAGERMGKSVDATNARVQLRAHGPRQPGAAGPRPRRLLRRVDAAASQLATINAAEAQLLTVQPYDKSSLKAIEKGITEANLGLTPSNDGNIIRLVIPQLTEERRKQFVKMVRHIAEEGRVAIRNVRRDVMHDLRELKDEGRRRRGRGAPRGERACRKLT